MVLKKMGDYRSILCRFGGRIQVDKREKELIDNFVSTIEPKLKLVSGYRNRLLEPFRLCRAHCRAIVEKIPGPIYLKKRGYSEDPAVRVFFAGSDRVEELLFQADRKKTAQTTLSGFDRVGLLTMTSKEKTIFGSKKQGDMIVGDAAMRAITFTNHNLVGLATSLADSKKALEQYCLDIIAEAVARQLSEIRTRLVDLRQRKEKLRAMNKMFGGEARAGMGCVFVPFDPEKKIKQQKLEQMMVENESELAAASRKSEMPEDWLAIVHDLLSRPEDILSIQPVTLRLNWCNVLTDDPYEKAEIITFATFTLADEMQREGILVAYEQEQQ